MIDINQRKPNGVIIVSADMPEIKTEHLDNMIQIFAKNPIKGIVRATSFDDKPGNPVLFSNKFFDQLIKLKNDQGGKKIVSDNQECVQHIQLPGNVALTDLDTPEQWDIWKKNLKSPH